MGGSPSTRLCTILSRVLGALVWGFVQWGYPCMPKMARGVVPSVDNCFVDQYDTTLRSLEKITPPPTYWLKCLTKKVVLQEIYYQVYTKVGGVLSWMKKNSQPQIPIPLRSYELKEINRVKEYFEALTLLRFWDLILHRYDPWYTMKDHCK